MAEGESSVETWVRGGLKKLISSPKAETMAGILGKALSVIEDRHVGISVS